MSLVDTEFRFNSFNQYSLDYAFEVWTNVIDMVTTFQSTINNDSHTLKACTR